MVYYVECDVTTASILIEFWKNHNEYSNFVGNLALTDYRLEKALVCVD